MHIPICSSQSSVLVYLAVGEALGGNPSGADSQRQEPKLSFDCHPWDRPHTL